MSGEEYLARKYCEPTPYWHCLRELSGGNHYSFHELNYPEYWLDALGKYTQQKPSAAAKQLHRRVEAGRDEFRAKQDRIYGNRNVLQRDGLEDIYRREDKTGDAFNAHKKDCLRAYLKAIVTGKIERQRARRRHRCEGEGCRELLSGRARFCDICKRARHRKAARVYRRNQTCSVISYTREISPKNRPFGSLDTRKTFHGNQNLQTLRWRKEALTGDRGDKDAPAIKPHKRRGAEGKDFLRRYTLTSTT
jgi:hypothetical protein